MINSISLFFYKVLNFFGDLRISFFTTWDTALPFNIWFNMPLFSKSNNLLFFQLNKSTLYDKKHFGVLNLNTGKITKNNNDFSSSLEAFNKNNNFALKALGNQLISNFDFLKVMIKGDCPVDQFIINNAKTKTQEIIQHHLNNGHYYSEDNFDSLVQEALAI